MYVSKIMVIMHSYLKMHKKEGYKTKNYQPKLQTKAIYLGNSETF